MAMVHRRFCANPSKSWTDTRDSDQDEGEDEYHDSMVEPGFDGGDESREGCS